MLPSRRNVVRTAAWTVPVVAAAVGAPAFAASCGTTSYTWRLDWGNETTDDAFSTAYPSAPTTNAQGVRAGTATITGPAGTTPMTVSFTSTSVGTDTRTNNNLRVDAGTYPSIGGTGGTGLLLQHQNITSGRANSRQEVVIAFGRPVTNLQFSVTDIDSNDQQGNNNDFYDQVELTGTRSYTFTSRGGGNTYVIGAGTQNDPWHMYNDDTVANDSGANSDRGNVNLTYPGPVSSITLTYWTSRGSGNQAIFLSDFTFTAMGC
ncbi:exported hypothetical protein [metagenome]|uniref:Lipoprotein n=1 Tax=metagenome TaxID=256318 RepID=A0A2P2CJT8_9ZZZZ